MSSRKIKLIGNYALDRSISMEAFGNCLAREYRRLGLEVELARPKPTLGRLGRGTALSKWFGYLDKFLLFPREIRKWPPGSAECDLVHVIDQAGAIYNQYLQSWPNLLTCNDLIAVRSALGEIPEHRTRASGRILQRTILRGISRTGFVVCISRATQRDLLRLTSIPPERTSVIHMGLHHPYEQLPAGVAWERLKNVAPALEPSTPFLLHVGGNQWYKNRAALVKAFASVLNSFPAGLKLVLAGKPADPALRHNLQRLGVVHDVVEVSNCSAEVLQALYSLAAMLVFPSLYEGFGWPLIEAQACCCPVVTSNRPPMTEVAGEGAIFVDPTNPQEIASAIKEVLTQPARREMLRNVGLANSRRYSLQGMITSYLELYERLGRSFLPAKQVETSKSMVQNECASSI